PTPAGVGRPGRSRGVSREGRTSRSPACTRYRPSFGDRQPFMTTSLPPADSTFAPFDARDAAAIGGEDRSRKGLCPNCAHTQPISAHLTPRRLTVRTRPDGPEMV